MVNNGINKSINNRITVMDCKRCQWQWASKAPERVKVCPKCRTPYWDRERKQGDQLPDLPAPPGKRIINEDIGLINAMTKNKKGATC